MVSPRTPAPRAGRAQLDELQRRLDESERRYGALLAETSAKRKRSRPADHDQHFALTTGGHRAAACASCHTDVRRPQLVRCDGCHERTALRQQHRGSAVPAQATACLRCHPRGAAR